MKLNTTLVHSNISKMLKEKKSIQVIKVYEFEGEYTYWITKNDALATFDIDVYGNEEDGIEILLTSARIQLFENN